MSRIDAKELRKAVCHGSKEKNVNIIQRGKKKGREAYAHNEILFFFLFFFLQSFNISIVYAFTRNRGSNFFFVLLELDVR